MNDLELTAELREDRCPNCMPKGTELPVGYRIDTDRDSLVCDYACAACGFTWFTSWAISGLAGAWPSQ